MAAKGIDTTHRQLAPNQDRLPQSSTNPHHYLLDRLRDLLRTKRLIHGSTMHGKDWGAPWGCSLVFLLLPRDTLGLGQRAVVNVVAEKVSSVHG